MRWRDHPWLPARPWLGAQRVHIRPSRAGLAFAALLLALWIAAVNYRLGLGYALTYVAAACAIADMLFASRNLAGLALAAVPGPPVFAGSHAVFTLRLINRSSRPRHAIRLAVTAAAAAPHLADIPAHGDTAVSIGVAAPQRGWLPAPPVRLSGSFPLGLFLAWCHWQPEARVLVYPQPEAAAPGKSPACAPTSRATRCSAWPGARSPATTANICSASNSCPPPKHPRALPRATSCSTTPPCPRCRRRHGWRAWPPGCWRRNGTACPTACAWAR
nr:hypothetical protein [Janthinobacterium sp.]